MIAGIFIPGGTQVRVPSHVIQRDPANFERSTEYDPDRWLQHKIGDEKNGFNRAAFLPLFVHFSHKNKDHATDKISLAFFQPFWSLPVSRLSL